ncbi:MAG: 6,7-dimethyl-8-ribityllumazine synthase [Bacteroidetes bacterium]|nr:6,7-dimethyl-8-ribityllumazine synthase [Bacteroidota bacterium]
MAGHLKTSTGKKITRKIGKIGIVVSKWNEDITEALLLGALESLKASGVSTKNILVRQVPGSFELPLAAQQLGQRKEVSGVICLGCLIKGDTPHFEVIAQATAGGIMEVGLKLNKPVVFGVITTLTRQQAIDRAGGKLGNKGEEAAATLLELLG